MQATSSKRNTSNDNDNHGGAESRRIEVLLTLMKAQVQGQTNYHLIIHHTCVPGGVDLRLFFTTFGICRVCGSGT